ncbi:Os02g0789300 [Oryza sativa Japonica Group]|jgi:hypothetical protein|uniref:Uncharacterized protein n=2 Tax=Oryza sativa subsp. japonica TaxID=39947 RepID=Q6KAG2_ORYSJ|nr:hypothetical protein [Oryza sativa Japonica Group]BAD19872.1 hypothetical protein [Oryza sativa Japonica Group]BAS81302.1 Os02g0789200 [Oryza sativa Japonica Group]BAS81303.1 Os02g0789300 [Oryza sativa Japonica Group]
MRVPGARAHEGKSTYESQKEWRDLTRVHVVSRDVLSFLGIPTGASCARQLGNRETGLGGGEWATLLVVYALGGSSIRSSRAGG